MKQTPQCCGNSKCQTTQTPLWRKGWFTQEGKTVMLCNACGLHYKKGHYCMYCNQIYRESDADDHANPWIGCDRCSRWVHQKCEEANGHHWKQHDSYQCPDCRCSAPSSDAKIATVPTIITTPSTTQVRKRSSQKKKRRTPSGSREDGDASPMSTQMSPNTPISPITPGSNFVLFSQPEQKIEPTTYSVFEANANVAMPCWNQLHASIQSLPAGTASPSTPTGSRKRKLDTTTTTTTKQKKSRTTTTITTTTTHRMNAAGIDALMGVAEEKADIPHLDVHITTTVRKGKQTPRKMNADARSAAMAQSTDTPTTPTSFYAPPLFATMTTTTTTVASADENAAKNTAALSEEQFYQYKQLILKQQNEGVQKDGVEVSVSPAKQAPVTILQNTFGKVDTLGNFYGSFNESKQAPETSPYGLLTDEDYETSETRRPQKRARRVSPPKKVTTTTTTLTMTVSSSASHVKSKRVRDQMAKNGGQRVVYSGTSSDTEESDHEYEPVVQDTAPNRWEEAAKALNVDLDDAYSMMTTRFPSAPVLKKMGSLWALCEVIRQQQYDM